MLLPMLLLVVSIVVLYYGAEFSLNSSEKIGEKIGLSPLAIGMLIIGFGTSLPELFVGHIAGIQGKTAMAIGSLVGSNIANMFLILGVSGLLAKLTLKDKKIKDQLIIHLVLGLILVFCLTRERFNILTAMPLIALSAFYLYVLYLDLKNEKHLHKKEDDNFNAPLIMIKLVAGFGMLYLGGELLVKAGTDICVLLGISEYIISAIFIAFGTSFPELITSIMATFRKKDTDLIVGNIIGSNVFNCAFILGSLGVYDFKIDGNYFYEFLALIAGAAFLLLLSIARKNFTRVSGGIFVAAYIGIVLFWIKDI